MPSTFRNAKKKALQFYKSWRATPVYCPAFGSKVKISLVGWNHIAGVTGHKKRSYTDIHRRFLLLPYAKQVIENSSTVQNITHKKGKKYFILEAMLPVNLNKILEYRKVRVILLEDKKGEKIFYSVMDRR